MIYVMGIEGHTPVKIGCVKGWTEVEQRRQALQTGCPYELKVLAECPGDLGMEALLHGYFETWHTRGEWFDIPLEIVPAWDDVYLIMTLFTIILARQGYELSGDYWPKPEQPPLIASAAHHVEPNQKGSAT